LRELITRYGRPRAIRSDNGGELVAAALKAELEKHHIQLANIEPGKPWQNGSSESFNGTFRKECLNAEVFGSLTEARVMIEKWRIEQHSFCKFGYPSIASVSVKTT
jgi:putative transposase